MGFLRKTISDQDWLLSALPLYESAVPIVGTISEAFSKGYRKELNGAIDKVLDELPSLAEQLSRLPNPESKAARVAAWNLRLSLRAYLRLARELSSLYELTGRGLHQAITSHAHTGELLYSAHLSAISAIAGYAAQSLREANDFFSRVCQRASPLAEPE
jgi:hypothetical protein